jgi:hypothetical protein
MLSKELYHMYIKRGMGERRRSYFEGVQCLG